MARRQIIINDRISVRKARLNKEDIILLTLRNKWSNGEIDGNIFRSWDEDKELVTVRVSKKTALELVKVIKQLINNT